MKRTLKYKANWLSRMTFILFGLFFLHSNLGAFLSQIEIGNNVGVFEYSLELEDDFSGQVVECSFPDSYSSFSRVSEPKNAHIKGVEVAAKASSRILSWGKNSKGHLIKHADALGFGSRTPQQLQKMLPELRGAANQLLNNANPALTRVGNWNQVQNAHMYISNGKMLVTRANGEFLTVINKTANKWYNAAAPLR